MISQRRDCTDQLVSNHIGLIPQASGGLMADRVVGATIHVNHFSDFVYVFLMHVLLGEVTLTSKQGYKERQHHKELRFVDITQKMEDTAIKAFAIHVMLPGKSCLSMVLVPITKMASQKLKSNAYLMHSNSVVACQTTLAQVSPEEKFCDTKLVQDLKNEHTWGCPIYVLDQKLQDGTEGLPKWNPRACIGINLGRCCLHTENVHLILNPCTGHVSPQYHIVFDDDFSTVLYLHSGKVPSFWKELVVAGAVRYTTEEFLDEDTWSLPNDAKSKTDKDLELPILLQENNTKLCTELDLNADLLESCNNAPTQLSTHHKEDNSINRNQVMPQMIDLASAGLRRSTRKKTLTNKAMESSDFEIQKMFGLCTKLKSLVTKASDVKQLPQQLYQCAIYNIEVSNCLYDESLNYLYPMVFAADQQQNKMYTFKDMMKQEDHKHFIVAILKEIEVHEGRQHWTCMLKSQ
eukprot:7635482-Ditylum_brightwellii.AAC.1